MKKLPCGHSPSAIVSSGEGTMYCGDCAKIAEAAAGLELEDLRLWRADEQGQTRVLGRLNLFVRTEGTSIRHANAALVAMRLLKQLAKP